MATEYKLTPAGREAKARTGDLGIFLILIGRRRTLPAITAAFARHNEGEPPEVIASRASFLQHLDVYLEEALQAGFLEPAGSPAPPVIRRAGS